MNDQELVIREALLTWYQKAHRILPWRQSKDPWQIWVSEIMLQQTRVSSVLNYFPRFIERYPHPTALASSDEEELNTYWAGLGYYARARNLLVASKQVVDLYQGQIPNQPEQFAALKGVGPYTKGAVMSIAFDLEEAIVDGNVMRVFSRLFAIKEDIALPSTQQKFWDISKRMVKGRNPGDFNQSLMELGATVCIPKNPNCLLCPVREVCTAYQSQEVQKLPFKSPKSKIPEFEYYAMVLRDEKQRVLLGLRESRGLLGGLWCLPMYQSSTLFDLKEEIAQISHAFTHKKWILHLYAFDQSEIDLKIDLSGEENQRVRWTFFDESQLSDLAISGPSLKALLAMNMKIKIRRGAGQKMLDLEKGK